MDIELSLWQGQGLTRFGSDALSWRFVCPDCGHVQSAQDFIDMGMSTKLAGTIAGYSCIMRWKDLSCKSQGRGPTRLLITADEIRPTFDWAPNETVQDS